MAQDQDWAKKYLDDLNRKISETRKNGSTEPPKDARQKNPKEDKRPEARQERGGRRGKFRFKQPRQGSRDETPPRKGDQDRKNDRKPLPKPSPPSHIKPAVPLRPKTATGIVAAVEGHRVTVLSDQREVSCSVKDHVQKLGPLYVGDQVRFVPESEGRGAVDSCGPRQNVVVAPHSRSQENEPVLAANVNQILLVVSVKEPVLRTDWLDRHLVVCEKKGFKPVLCCTKIDLADDNGFMEQLDWYKRLGYRVMYHSSILPTYVADIRSLLKGKTTVVTGHAGCGKTELVRSVIAKPLSFDYAAGEEGGTDVIVDEYVETKMVRAQRLEGGGLIIDTPGIREYELQGIARRDLKKYFRELRQLNHQCASPHCLHADEPGCKVRQAVDHAEISEDRYQSYLKILESLT